MSTSTAVGRIAAVLALIGAFVLVFILLLGGGDQYKVTGKFVNASQLVEGNTVAVAGVAMGTITSIDLDDDGTALVEMKIDDTYAPLKQGTTATIRSHSLSGIANRYIALELPEEGNPTELEEIPDGGTIERVDTVSEVDLDQFFNTLDEETVEGLKGVVRGFARAYDGVGPQANEGFKYLNPFLSTSRRVFGELNRDEAALERLIVDTAALSGTLAQRAPDLELLAENVSNSLGAIGRQEESLARAIGGLPDFMRQANTTFVNLRFTLDDLDPLVEASKPAARRLRPFMAELRGASRDLVPAIRDLDTVIRRQGRDNDLTELTRLQVPLGHIAGAKQADGTLVRNNGARDGAFPASTDALRDGLPALAFFRPYTPELVGWFDDFGHSGLYDANGGMGRIFTRFVFFSLVNIANIGLPALPPQALEGLPIPPASIEGLVGGVMKTHQRKRCPGANERAGTDPTNSVPFKPGGADDPFQDGGELNCDETQTAGGILEP